MSIASSASESETPEHWISNDRAAGDTAVSSAPKNLATVAAERVASFPPLSRDQSVLVRAMLTAKP